MSKEPPTSQPGGATNVPKPNGDTAGPCAASWDQGRLQNHTFRGGQAGRHLQLGADPRGLVFRVFCFRSLPADFRSTPCDINARHSMIGVLFTGPDIGKFHSGGRISAVFFDNTNVLADNNGFLLTQSYGELCNDKWRFAAGLQFDVFAPNLPTVSVLFRRWSRRSVTPSAANSGWSVT